LVFFGFALPAREYIATIDYSSFVAMILRGDQHDIIYN